MAGNIYNEKDSMEINELASLNEDISPELIEQLQLKVAQDAQNLTGEKTSVNINPNDDSTLFEEPVEKIEDIDSQEKKEIDSENKLEEDNVKEASSKPTINQDFDDNFIKKYKAKLQKQQMGNPVEDNSTISEVAFPKNESQDDSQKEEKKIDEITNGNITEKALTFEQKSYNDSLDFLDGNVKYSKYVIYIDPNNVDFIESLTVKERKNLINKIIKEQDDISITKQRFQLAQTILKHAIIAILTIAISIPVIYYTINASLEASINNYRRSQTNFQTLYKEKGKIQLNKTK